MVVDFVDRDRTPGPARGPDDETYFQLDVEARARLPLHLVVLHDMTVGSRDVGSRHDDGSRSAVIPDRDVPPVREQRFAVGPEQAAEIRRVVDACVHVDVVADLDREVHRQFDGRHEQPVVESVFDRAFHLAADRVPCVSPEREEVVERIAREHLGRRTQVDTRSEREQVECVVTDRDVGTRWRRAPASDAVGEVGEREVGAQRLPRRACSASIDMNKARKLPSPKPRAPSRWMISMNAVGRLATGSVNTWRR